LIAVTLIKAAPLFLVNVNIRRLGVTFDFTKSPILGNALGKVDERIGLSVGGVLSNHAQQTVQTDGKSTLRII
jgi:hypothetical protein